MARLIKYAVAGIIVGLLLENKTLTVLNDITRKKYKLEKGLKKKLATAKAEK